MPLVGAAGYEARANQRAALARASGIHRARVEHLLGRYGGLVDEVLALIETRPELAEPLPGAEDYLAAEIVYAVTHEGPATSTTCSPAAPGSRSRPSTAESPRPVRPPS